MMELFKTNITELDDVFIRGVFSLVTLFLVTKVIGKKQVSQMSLFDYVIGISIGNFAAEMTVDINIPFLNGIVAVIIFGVFAQIINYVTMKSIYLRRFFMGTPTILIDNGKILEKGLKKVKMDINDLLEECRNAGFFDMSQIESAVMEVNGKLSILPKSEYRPLTPNDMNIKVEKEYIKSPVIIDGKIMINNLKNMKKTENWLKKSLKSLGYKNIENLLLVIIDNSNNIDVYTKNNVNVPEILE